MLSDGVKRSLRGFDPFLKGIDILGGITAPDVARSYRRLAEAIFASEMTYRDGGWAQGPTKNAARFPGRRLD